MKIGFEAGWQICVTFWHICAVFAQLCFAFRHCDLLLPLAYLCDVISDVFGEYLECLNEMHFDV